MYVIDANLQIIIVLLFFWMQYVGFETLFYDEGNLRANSLTLVG